MTSVAIRRSVLVAMLSAAAAGAAFAQADYPSRPVRIIVAQPPGSSVDTTARLLSNQLQARFRQSFTIENRPGGNSFPAARLVAGAPPDGYTLFVASNSPMTTNVVAFKDLPYDPVRDFVPAAMVTRFPMALTVNAGAPYRSLKDLIAALRKAPGKMSYGSSTATYRLAIEQFHAAFDLSAVHVPYKGTSLALVDLAGGNTDYTITDYSAAQPLAKAGKLRVLVVTGANRIKEIPDVPTMIESGIPGYEYYAWIGAFLPAKTDAAIVRRLGDAIADIQKSPETLSFLAGIGGEVFPADSAKAKEFQLNELENMRRTALKARMEPE